MSHNGSIDRYVLQQFRASLREQRIELQHTIDRVEQELRDAMDTTADHLDVSTRNAIKESLAARNTQNRRRLQILELALERIQNGSFGTCTACGGAIGMKRLQAIPSAIRCIACQERLEQGPFDMLASSNPAPESPQMQNSAS